MVLIDKAIEDKLNSIIPENIVVNKEKNALNIVNLTEQQLSQYGLLFNNTLKLILKLFIQF